jgi:putative ABC transport system substrate-binding protein
MGMTQMRRRDFVGLIGGAAVWPVVAPAQQDGPVRRVGVLVPGVHDDRAPQVKLTALREGLAKLGWIEGRNLRIDLRFGADDPNRIHTAAADLVSQAPDGAMRESG